MFTFILLFLIENNFVLFYLLLNFANVLIFNFLIDLILYQANAVHYLLNLK
jgi:hypothetical protein